jgi:hypothetical protein
VGGSRFVTRWEGPNLMLWKFPGCVSSRPTDESNLEVRIRKCTVLSMPVPRGSGFGSSYNVIEFCFLENCLWAEIFMLILGAFPLGVGFKVSFGRALWQACFVT